MEREEIQAEVVKHSRLLVTQAVQEAGKDVHVVVETNNSENLGKVIFEGEAEKDSGIPIPIMGLTFERVLHAPEAVYF